MTSSSEQCNILQSQQSLISGYVRRHFTVKSKRVFPSSLNQIIVGFTGLSLLLFDSTPEIFRSMIQSNGKSIKRERQNLSGIDGFIIGCSRGIRSGIVEINLQCIQPSGTDAIGILDDSTQFQQSLWIAQLSGYKYWWYDKSAICGEHDTVDLVPVTDVKQAWQPNDVITIKVDCIAWTVAFSVNGQLTHKMKLHPNLTYYFFVASQVGASASEYHLL